MGIAVEDKGDRMAILQSMLIQQYAYLKKMSTSIGLAILNGMQTSWWQLQLNHGNKEIHCKAWGDFSYYQ